MLGDPIENKWARAAWSMKPGYKSERMRSGEAFLSHPHSYSDICGLSLILKVFIVRDLFIVRNWGMWGYEDGGFQCFMRLKFTFSKLSFLQFWTLWIKAPPPLCCRSSLVLFQKHFHTESWSSSFQSSLSLLQLAWTWNKVCSNWVKGQLFNSLPQTTIFELLVKKLSKSKLHLIRWLLQEWFPFRPAKALRVCQLGKEMKRAATFSSTDIQWAFTQAPSLR